jgi:hypothetical protein
MQTVKILLTFILTILLSNGSYSQNADSIKALANAAIKAFTWHIEKSDRGTLMFLEVPYMRDNSGSTEYLTLTVAKEKTKERPEFISIIVPNNIVQSNGIFIKFTRSVTRNDVRTMELEKGKAVRVHFEKCDKETCTARIIDGYASQENGEREDIFQKFLDFDHVLFLFIYADGSHKSVAVPLFTFKQQYPKL